MGWRKPQKVNRSTNGTISFIILTDNCLTFDRFVKIWQICNSLNSLSISWQTRQTFYKFVKCFMNLSRFWQWCQILTKQDYFLIFIWPKFVDKSFNTLSNFLNSDKCFVKCLTKLETLSNFWQVYKIVIDDQCVK